MKTSLKAKKLAKQIWQVCSANNQVNEEKFQKFIEILSSNDKPMARQVLFEVKRRLETFEKQQTLLVDSAFPVESTLAQELLKGFKQKTKQNLILQERTDKSLVAGVRVQYIDDVWENSVVSYLENLKGSLSNE